MNKELAILGGSYNCCQRLYCKGFTKVEERSFKRCIPDVSWNCFCLFQSELESCMIQLPLLALPSMIKLLAFNFFMCPLFSAFRFQLFTPKILWLLAFSSWLSASFPALAFFSSKIKKNRQKAKSWRKIKLLAFRFYHQNFSSAFCFQLFTPAIVWLYGS